MPCHASVRAFIHASVMRCERRRATRAATRSSCEHACDSERAPRGREAALRQRLRSRQRQRRQHEHSAPTLHCTHARPAPDNPARLCTQKTTRNRAAVIRSRPPRVLCGLLPAGSLDVQAHGGHCLRAAHKPQCRALEAADQPCDERRLRLLVRQVAVLWRRLLHGLDACRSPGRMRKQGRDYTRGWAEYPGTWGEGAGIRAPRARRVHLGRGGAIASLLKSAEH